MLPAGRPILRLAAAAVFAPAAASGFRPCISAVPRLLSRLPAASQRLCAAGRRA
jgi:hypothetical protein